ncbi:uncharacterized protein E0L32_006743 [Thyridium curvatum]|uniref:Chalcone isomerase domain-containing protein n=1 Tax=Thyridium curvatum TaxID=1093900 RepID=A0A507AZ05_9PEZI|nr:uncharacterized protein E0L32_006743 [Thyridium curvatum]TPX12863.1 hypothetical protein E0L32_006743 [Thyridium curvatum]
MYRQPAVRALARHTRQAGPVSRRAFLSRKSSSGRSLDGLNVRRLAQEREEYDRTRRNFLVAGAVAGVISFAYTAWKLKEALDNPTKLDTALPPSDPLVAGTDAKRKVVIHDEDGQELVPTGNSTVPQFPRTIELPSHLEPTSTSEPSAPTSLVPAPGAQRTEYTLVGVGTRTVTILGIQVYVVGYYIATADIAALQSRLVKKINPIATTLVPGERDDLRKMLLDPAAGEDLWEELLKDGVPARSLFRVVPVRDTDFHHLRDGFVRAIQARGDKLALPLPQDPAREFGESVREFRHIFNRGKAPKKQELMMVRGGDGSLGVVYDDGRSFGRQLLGTVRDERLSRGLWLNYLAGKKVASEPARTSICDGIMEFVERPVGTVAAQVV